MGVHHDNFDMWNSKHQRWNAANMGPKKDVVGMWRDAARKAGLRFGVSEHLWISYKWFAVSHGADQTGPLAGVPYDGGDPQYQDLYYNLSLKGLPPLPKLEWNDADIPESFKRHWYLRIKDLVDHYEPDLLYTDGAMPFESYGMNLVAHHYNLSAKRYGGRTQAIYNSKRQEDCAAGTCVLDVERGVVDKVWPTAWQTDTCVGDWHYKKGIQYKSPKTVVDMLCDIVSRNGNLLLNFPLPNSGMPDADELHIVAEITKWMSVNSEGIYGTRPWKIYGEGPSTTETKQQAAFNENKKKALGATDVRFTTKGRNLYAFVMGWPEKQAVVNSLGLGSAEKIGKVELLGRGEKLQFTQDASGLAVSLPAEQTSDYAVALKVSWA
jgi:alpha-L-fucosidase